MNATVRCKRCGAIVRGWPWVQQGLCRNTEACSRRTAGDQGPKPGRVFLHSRWLTEDRQPMPCIITKVAQGLVYYRAAEPAGIGGWLAVGSPYTTPVDKFEADRVKGWVR